ncbi:MAG: glycosyltransferase family 39 protein [Ardenticatenaceae bacterium]|nr:glycosyltransferase family 39 protein [Ardenticatenaceae bacterium]
MSTHSRQQHWPFWVLLLAYLSLTLVYSATFPPFEGPDEPQHLAYIEWLVTRRQLPPQGDAAWETPIQQEAGQPPFYYLLAALPARLAGFNPPAIYRPNPYFIGPFPRDNIDNDHRAIHEPGDGQPLRGGWLALRLARLVTTGFGLLLVGGVYLLGWQLRPAGTRIPLAAAALVAFTPQVLFLSGVASNDIPAAALSTLTLWQLAILLRRGPDPGRGALIGLLLGLATLTKVSASLLAVPLGLGLLWQFVTVPRPGRRAVFFSGLATVGSSLLAAGWWFWRNWRLYGSPLGLATHDRTSWAIRDPADLASPYLRWLEVFRSYWAGFGWGTIRPPGWVYSLLLGFTLLALLGLAWAAWRWWRRPPAPTGPRLGITPLLYLLLATTLLLTMLFLESWMRRVSAPYGRLLFPAIGAIALLLVSGWHRLHPRLPLLACAFAGGLALLAPWLIIRPAYTPPPPLTAAEVAALPPGPGWRFLDPAGTPVAELVSITPLVTSLDTNPAYDQTLPVQVCWRALAQTERPYTVLLHVIGPENALVANRRTYPGLGLWPTHLWTPGDVICDLTRVLIRTTQVPQTLAYQLEIGLLDDAATGGSDARLVAVDAQGQPLNATFTGRVRLAAPNTLQVQPQAGGPPIQLVDYELAARWTPGREAPFRLTWTAAAPLPGDYQTFVHLRDPANGQNVAQADGPPLAGWYPTSWWPAGEAVTDWRNFPLPADLPPGRYRLVVGFYDLAGQQRVGQEFDLGLVEVQP